MESKSQTFVGGGTNGGTCSRLIDEMPAFSGLPGVHVNPSFSANDNGLTLVQLQAVFLWSERLRHRRFGWKASSATGAG